MGNTLIGVLKLRKDLSFSFLDNPVVVTHVLLVMELKSYD